MTTRALCADTAKKKLLSQVLHINISDFTARRKLKQRICEKYETYPSRVMHKGLEEQPDKNNQKDLLICSSISVF